MITLLHGLMKVPFFFLLFFTFTHFTTVSLLVVHLSEAAFVNVPSVTISVFLIMRVIACDLAKLFLPAPILFGWRSASACVFVIMRLLFGLLEGVLLFVEHFFLTSLFYPSLFFFQLLLLRRKFLLQLLQVSLHFFSLCFDVLLLSQFLHLLKVWSFFILWYSLLWLLLFFFRPLVFGNVEFVLTLWMLRDGLFKSCSFRVKGSLNFNLLAEWRLNRLRLSLGIGKFCGKTVKEIFGSVWAFKC